MDTKLEERIQQAKCRVHLWAGDTNQRREWLEAQPPPSYADLTYRVRLFVLEGSPPAGYVIADDSSGRVIALDSVFARKKLFEKQPWR